MKAESERTKKERANEPYVIAVAWFVAGWMVAGIILAVVGLALGYGAGWTIQNKLPVSGRWKSALGLSLAIAPILAVAILRAVSKPK